LAFSQVSLVGKHFLNGGEITLSDMRGQAELTLPFRTLLGKDVSKVGLAAFETTFAGAAKAFRCTAIGFHLGHY
jgi:hypothetical protein